VAAIGPPERGMWAFGMADRGEMMKVAGLITSRGVVRAEITVRMLNWPRLSQARSSEGIEASFHASPTRTLESTWPFMGKQRQARSQKQVVKTTSR
jgi:hypothetical protein